VKYDRISLALLHTDKVPVKYDCISPALLYTDK
jgi:hypothetical protein